MNGDECAERLRQLLAGDGEVAASHHRERAERLVTDGANGGNVRGRPSPLEKGNQVVAVPRHGARLNTDVTYRDLVLARLAQRRIEILEGYQPLDGPIKPIYNCSKHRGLAFKPGHNNKLVPMAGCYMCKLTMGYDEPLTGSEVARKVVSNFNCTGRMQNAIYHSLQLARFPL